MIRQVLKLSHALLLLALAGQPVGYADTDENPSVPAIRSFSNQVSALVVANRIVPDEEQYGRLLDRQVVGTTFLENHSFHGEGRYLVYRFQSRFEKQAACREEVTMKLTENVWQSIAYWIDC